MTRDELEAVIRRSIAAVAAAAMISGSIRPAEEALRAILAAADRYAGQQATGDTPELTAIRRRELHAATGGRR